MMMMMMIMVCRGVRGTRGPPGTPGSDGVPGVPGNDGRAGLKGEKGDNVIIQHNIYTQKTVDIYYVISTVCPFQRDLSANLKVSPDRRAGLDWASWAPGSPRPGDGPQHPLQHGLGRPQPAEGRAGHLGPAGVQGGEGGEGLGRS